MKTCFAFTLLALGSGLLPSNAHPHHQQSWEDLEAMRRTKRSLASCSQKLSKRGHVDRGIARRMALAESIRRKRGLETKQPYKRRDLDTALATSHLSDLEDLTQYTLPSYLFGSNTTCAMVADPDVTEGPYFVAGEYVRQDLREGQDGVDLYLDIELIDITTCEPVPDTYIEIWNANATGVYSGVVVQGNGAGLEDESNSLNTALRGAQRTSEDGAVQFTTIVPGHYTGRATHLHVASFINATASWNGTLYSTTASHVGQLFMDTELLDLVAAVEPYASNTQTVTPNSEDSILSQAAADIDPFVEYVLLGEDVSDGVLAWSTLAIDTGNSINMNAAAIRYKDYTQENSNAMGGGGGGGGQGGSPPGESGNGTMPSGGGMPSGSGAPSASAAASGTSQVGGFVRSDSMSTAAAATTTASASGAAYTCACSA